MNIRNLTYPLLFLAFFFSACSSEDIADSPLLPGDETWTEEEIDGPSVTVKPFLPGDAVSRSSFEFNGQNLVFGWSKNDAVGLYPTAMIPQTEDDKKSCLSPADFQHPEENVWRIAPEKSFQREFICRESDGSQTARLFNNDTDFEWDELGRWTAYFPYKNVDPDAVTYEARSFSFEKQTQEGLPDMTAYYNGAGGKPAGSDNPTYRASEALACQHLGAKDVLISPEMSWSGSRISFPMRHLGAVIRLFLLAPAENFVITNIKLICDKAIFYNSGTFNLKSHLYKPSEENKGVNLDLSDEDCQISPSGEPQKMIELNFKGETAKTYVESTMLKRYLVAYMMTYPITYNPASDGNLFAYVTAYMQGDASKKEYHFVTNPLTGKEMKSGYYYQWTEVTHPDDGLYPIEMTATLKPWQEIIGADIDLDCEK